VEKYIIQSEFCACCLEINSAGDQLRRCRLSSSGVGVYCTL